MHQPTQLGDSSQSAFNFTLLLVREKGILMSMLVWTVSERAFRWDRLHQDGSWRLVGCRHLRKHEGILCQFKMVCWRSLGFRC